MRILAMRFAPVPMAAVLLLLSGCAEYKAKMAAEQAAGRREVSFIWRSARRSGLRSMPCTVRRYPDTGPSNRSRWAATARLLRGPCTVAIGCMCKCCQAKVWLFQTSAKMNFLSFDEYGS